MIFGYLILEQHKYEYIIKILYLWFRFVFPFHLFKINVFRLDILFVYSYSRVVSNFFWWLKKNVSVLRIQPFNSPLVVFVLWRQQFRSMLMRTVISELILFSGRIRHVIIEYIHHHHSSYFEVYIWLGFISNL